MPDEIVIAGGNRLRITHDTLSIRELLVMVEAGVSWWQQQLMHNADVDREHAAAAIKDLSRILNSLSEQLAQGRETIRITTRLPVLREYSVGCAVCGRGNRAGARFCSACGARLPTSSNQHVAGSGRVSVRLQIAMRSDIGRVREANEDFCQTRRFVLPDGGEVTLLLVADGMGGAQAGADASRLAAESVERDLESRLQQGTPGDDAGWHTLLRDVVQAANRYVYDLAQADAARHGMGTTLTLGLVSGNRVHLAHIGDSRAYLINAEGVAEDGSRSIQMTSDHTLVARLVDVGQLTPEQARHHEYRNMLYRVLGTDAVVDVDTSSQALRSGDVLLLCSDGLTGTITDADLARIVLDYAVPAQACAYLVTYANQHGGQDNISVIVARVEER